MRYLHSLLLLSVALTALSACDAIVEPPPETPEAGFVIAALEHPVVPSKELFVTALNVVDDTRYVNYRAGKWNTDADGGWSFGRLIDNMSSVEKPSDTARSAFVMNWLRTWETPQTINGQTLAARPAVRAVVIDAWKQRSIGRLPGNTASTCAPGRTTDFQCKLSFAAADVPFELVAIVNRPDLRVVPTSTDGTTGSAAQGRFIFVLVDGEKNPLPFTVIFEYMVPVSSSSDIKAYAEEWHELGETNFGRSFNAELHALTLSFTKWNVAPWRNNGSALLQIRTNDVMFAEPGSDPSHPFGVMWELREFVVGANGQLTPDTVKLEPSLALSGSPLLAEWANANAAAILTGVFEVPASFQGQPLLAGSSFAPFGFVWDLPGVPEDVRNSFALNTCNGCHVNETGTGFLHTFQFVKGAEATLSPFLVSQLAANGPRVADFTSVLGSSWTVVKDGKGRDKGNKPSDGRGRR